MLNLDAEIEKIGKAVECTAEYFKTLYKIIDQIYPSQPEGTQEKSIKVSESNSSVQNSSILKNIQTFQGMSQPMKPVNAIELLKNAHENAKKEKTKSKKSTSLQRKKREKTQDIEGVKKPSSPFFLFVESIKNSKSEAELNTIGNLYKFAGEEWRKLDKDKQAFWSSKFNEIKREYDLKKKELEDKENQANDVYSNDFANALPNLKFCISNGEDEEEQINSNISTLFRS